MPNGDSDSRHMCCACLYDIVTIDYTVLDGLLVNLVFHFRHDYYA